MVIGFSCQSVFADQTFVGTAKKEKISEHKVKITCPPPQAEICYTILSNGQLEYDNKLWDKIQAVGPNGDILTPEEIDNGAEVDHVIIDTSEE